MPGDGARSKNLVHKHTHLQSRAKDLIFNVSAIIISPRSDLKVSSVYYPHTSTHACAHTHTQSRAEDLIFNVRAKP